MLFNSYGFIFAFLPIVYGVFLCLAKYRATALGLRWLTLSSILFYGYWDYRCVPLLLGSIAGNYLLGRKLIPKSSPSNDGTSVILVLGIVANLGILGYFKYANFFVSNLASLFGTAAAPLDIVFPLAISFFTFQQIAFLVDATKGRIASVPKFGEYALFISFFPQLIAGPIVHHKELMPQFAKPYVAHDWPQHLAHGGTRFFLGLFKKIVVADFFAVWANLAHSQPAELSTWQAWAGMLSYTLQIYYDFSGYSDMAIGAARLFGIKLPENFHSPYKALDIQDLWRRWHITLGRFFKDYIYLPLGGNRVGLARQLLNVFIVFVLSGFWHGASWNMVIWGAIHGGACVISRLWSLTPVRIPRLLSWAATFLTMAIAFVFFRASSFDQALTFLTKLCHLAPDSNAWSLPEWQIYGQFLASNSGNFPEWLFGAPGGWLGVLPMIAIALALTFQLPNSSELLAKGVGSHQKLFISTIMATILVLVITNSYWRISDEFIYFQF